MPGVEAYYGAKDIPGSNWIGPVVQDEEVFASEFVTCVGQVCVCVIGVRRMARSVAGVASESVTCVGQVRVCHRG